jgi:hypothetical protein
MIMQDYIKQLCYGSVIWTLTQMTEQMLCTLEREMLRRIYGPMQDKGRWRPRWNSEIYLFLQTSPYRERY